MHSTDICHYQKVMIKGLVYISIKKRKKEKERTSKKSKPFLIISVNFILVVKVKLILKRNQIIIIIKNY
jgi:hypothetical protein